MVFGFRIYIPYNCDQRISTNPSKTGSRLSQMIVSHLIKYESFSIDDIGGMIHITGTVFTNGQTYQELSDKHSQIVNKPEFKQENNIIQFGCINDDECWMRINTIEFAQILKIRIQKSNIILLKSILRRV